MADAHTGASMRVWPAAVVALAVVALVPSALARPADPAAGSRAADATGEAIRRGGHVVALAGTSGRCRVPAAAALARALREFVVPVGSVLSSPACRRAAAAAFGVVSSPRTLATRKGLRAALARRPGGANAIVVAPARALAAARSVRLAAGEAAVLRGPRLVARVPANGWEPLLVLPPQGADSPFREFRVPRGTHPHDVAPAPDGTVWYTEQLKGALGRLDPRTGRLTHVALGGGSAPHGVIVGPDGAAWITDQGLNANVRVDPRTLEVRRFPIPTPTSAAPNTGVFDRRGVYWFTGASGWYGRLDPTTGDTRVWPAPRGAGPYGIAATPNGDVYFVSLQRSYVGRIDIDTGAVSVLEPPTPNQGARRIWSDARGRLWVAEWNAGQLGLYDPATGAWREWRLPGTNPQAYAVYVDEREVVWVTDFGANALVRFDPASEEFTPLPWPTAGALVRQLLGKPGEVWGAESATDKLVVYRSG
jgi:virginiamycin B lyase